MKLTGTIINYYFHCKRQCWLFAHRINLEDNSEDVRIGRIMHELKSEGKANTKYFSHHQKSVFRGPISPSNLMKLKAELKKIIQEGEDCVTIIKLLSEDTFYEETIGTKANDSESIFI